jgi:hypothetical protein
MPGGPHAPGMCGDNDGVADGRCLRLVVIVEIVMNVVIVPVKQKQNGFNGIN